MFLHHLKKIINSGQSRSVVLTGNIHDLFFDGNSYVPLIPYLTSGCKLAPSETSKGIAQVIYELNSPVEVIDEDASAALQNVWKDGFPKSESLADRLLETTHNSTYALELLRQLAEKNRRSKKSNFNLLMLIEGADLLLPESEISRTQLADRRRIAVVHDWFSDPTFMNSGDTVVLIAESRSSIHHRISRLPQVLSVEIPLPDFEARAAFIEHFVQSLPPPPVLTSPVSHLARRTSGLSLQAIRQLLLSRDLSEDNVNRKIEEYMVGQLGDGVVEFKRPSHKLDDVVGFRNVKQFMQNELIPGFKDGSISGAAVGGPIGGGKTFICEAVASELGISVLTLKNIRSKWFGETDQIFERLRRLLESFHRIVIFVDEADTQFGGVQDGHETERRLTGKVQAMMSDPQLKGRVIWFLMTARIHRLSPDIRRPGRMDLIIPILDPEGEDLDDFIHWTFEGIDLEPPPTGSGPLPDVLRTMFSGYSAASFSVLRSRIRSKGCKTIEEAMVIVEDILPPDIEETRRYQTLQAKLNCTRKSLLGKDCATQRPDWRKEIQRLEQLGIS